MREFENQAFFTTSYKFVFFVRVDLVHQFNPLEPLLDVLCTFDLQVVFTEINLWNQSVFFKMNDKKTQRLFRRYNLFKISFLLQYDYFMNLNQNIRPANIFLFQDNNRNSRKRCEICSKLTIKTSERHRLINFEIFIENTLSTLLK